ncbi:carboxylesterase 3-like [Mya arenaria]|uniref:carboxylesterase 3-like n=1 Tax=Mya arenaria TaxID=6604 RepID=UPI0022E06F36|nr:carboxylesterase 3-like [Mya arenaria]
MIVSALFSIYLLTCVEIAACSKEDKKDAIVATKVGTFKGYIRPFTFLDETYRVRRFLGIPYAEPPVDTLRFQKPLTKLPVTGIYDATQYKPACFQTIIGLNGKRNPDAILQDAEDCLFLDIYAPAKTTASPVPVLIHIHGGGFVVGGAAIYPGDTLSAYGDIIVVVVSYRLSVFGFLSTGDKHLPGNYGLWDQHEAIKWVHNNIEAFGGDPNAITIGGHSAGAASAIYQSLYPGNVGLLKRTIAMSGAITCPWAFNSNPLKVTRRFAKLLDCDSENTKEIADCIRSKPSEELHHVLNDNNGFITFPMEFVTTVDDDLIPEPPNDLIHGDSDIAKERRNNFANLDFMTGLMSGEGLMNIASFCGVNDTLGFSLTQEQLENEEIPKISKIMFGENASETINKLLIAEYTNWKDPSNIDVVLDTFVKISGDYVFNIETIDMIRTYAGLSSKSSYLYFMDALVTQHILAVPAWAKQPNHGDEAALLFGFDTEDGFTKWSTPYGIEPKSWEYKLSKMFLTIFTNFIKSGNPNQPVNLGTVTDQNIEFEAYDLESEKYFILSNNTYSVGEHLYAREANFWLKLLPFVAETRKSEEHSPDGYCDSDGCN